MGTNIMVGIKDVVQWLFFVGLAGCTITVIWSWITVGRDAFSARNDEHDSQAQHPGLG